MEKEEGFIQVKKKHIEWGALATVILFLLVQTFLFGYWKSSIDSRLDDLERRNAQKFQEFQTHGSDVAIQTQKQMNNVIHNLKRLMEKNKVEWEEIVQ